MLWTFFIVFFLKNEINGTDNLRRRYSPSAFRSSSKFSDDFIVHFPEKSALFLSMFTLIVRVFADDRLLWLLCWSSLCSQVCWAASSGCICLSFDWLRPRLRPTLVQPMQTPLGLAEGDFPPPIPDLPSTSGRSGGILERTELWCWHQAGFYSDEMWYLQGDPLIPTLKQILNRFGDV